MQMWKRSRFSKRKGMTILETVMYLSISAIIIFATLIVMISMVKKADEENKTSFRVNKLYSTLNSIEKFVNFKRAKKVEYKFGFLFFFDITNNSKCAINEQGGALKFTRDGAPLYFMNKESCSTEVKSFECNIKGNLLYINIKLKTGEMMKKCIHIDH